MNNNYEIIHNLELLKKGYSTRFLDSKMQLELKKKLKKNEYQIYYPYDESEKVLFYTKKIPEITLLEIISKENLEHKDVLGSVFSLGIDSSMFGDIIISDNHYYIYVLKEIKDLFLNHFYVIKRTNIKVEERNLDLLKDYKREFCDIKIIVSSKRFDTIISKLIGVNRTKVLELIRMKDVLLNCEVLSNPSKKIIEGDIFSIRKYGKYKYIGVLNNTKNDNLILLIKKYI